MQSEFSMYLLPVSLAIIMAGMGLSLEKKDFVDVVKYPKPFLTGLISQVFILPIVAILLVGFTNLSPFVKVGFVLITACAGGSATNLITHILKGNLALSVSLTAINSLIILISLPLTVHLALVLFMDVDNNINLNVWDTVLNILVTIISPVVVGMYFRKRFYHFAIKAQGPLKILLSFLLLFVFIVIIFFEEESTQQSVYDYLYMVPWALLLNFVSMLTVYLIAKYLKLGGKNNFTLSIEVGLKNSIVGIYIAEVLLNNHEMAMVSVVYGSVTFFSTMLFGYIARRIEMWGFGYRKLF